MRVGILGGSFDPPHVGHLLVAQDAVASLRLDHLLVIPAAQQPLKRAQFAPATDRLAMVERTFGGVPRMAVDPIEIERGGLSFTVDTVEALERRMPLAEFHLLIGEDVVATLPDWHDPDRLRTLVRIVVLRRGDPVDGSPEKPNTNFVTHDAPGFPVQHLATRRVDVSSTEIRERVLAGSSIRGFVTDAVADYIASTGLYLRESIADSVTARA